MERLGKVKEKGFAMVLTVFLVLAMVIISASSFLIMTRQQNTIARMANRIEANWVAEGMIDYTIKQFSEFIRTHSKFPDYDTSDEVRNNVQGDPAGELFKDNVRTWFADNITGDPPGLGLTYLQLADNAPLADAVSVKQIEVEGGIPTNFNAWRRYEIRIRLKDTRTQEIQYVSQQIKVTTGKLFDFSVYYNQDLEIATGPSATIQGPIYTQGNIYLMTGRGSTLTLKAPGGGDETITEDYILRSSGNIYFYFKRALGVNYLLENPAYYSNVQRIRQASQDVGESPVTDYEADDKAELYRWWSYKAGPQADPQAARPLAPYFYFFRNNATLGNWNGGTDTNTIRLVTANDTAIRNLVPNWAPIHTGEGVWPWWTGFYTNYTPNGGTTYTCAWGYPGGCGYVSHKIYSEYGTNGMSVTPAFDIRYPPKFRDPDTWDPAKPMQGVAPEATGVTDPLVNPSWNNGNVLSTGGLVQDGIPLKTIAMGPSEDDQGNPNHNVIEPLHNAYSPGPESPEARAIKFEGKADIRIVCSGEKGSYGACTSLEIKNNAGQPLFISDSFKQEGFIYDYRLKGNVKVATLDFEVLRQALGSSLDINTLDSDNNGIVIYIGVASVTNNAEIGANSIRGVRIINGAKGLATKREDRIKGFTIASNGRLWIQGDYNIYEYNDNGSVGNECTYDRLTAKQCSVPPAAIFSDSFGVLSKSWSDTWNASTTLDQRKVSGVVTVYAAIVTGLLESQLERKYQCDNNMKCNCIGMGVGGWEDCHWTEGGSATDSPMSWGWQGYFSESYEEGTSNIYYLDKTHPTVQQYAINPINSVLNKTPSPQQWAKDNPIPMYITGPATAGSTLCSTLPVKPVPTAAYPGIVHTVLSREHLFGVAIQFGACSGIIKQTYYDPGGEGSRIITGTQCVDSETGENAGHSYVAAAPHLQRDNGWQWVTPAALPGYTYDADGDMTGGGEPITVHRAQKFIHRHTGCSRDGHALIYFPGMTDNSLLFEEDGEWYRCTYSIRHPTLNPSGQLEPQNVVTKNIHQLKIPQTVQFRPAGQLDANGYPIEAGVNAGDLVYRTWNSWEWIAKKADGTFYTMYWGTKYTGNTSIFDIVDNPTGTLVPLTQANYNPNVYYYHTRYFPLYNTRYSGGLENLINLQEDWLTNSTKPSGDPEQAVLNFSGVLTSPWFSQELVALNGAARQKAFFNANYYRAPGRNYDYYENFIENPPPATPGIYGILREQYKELSDNASGEG